MARWPWQRPAFDSADDRRTEVVLAKLAVAVEKYEQAAARVEARLEGRVDGD